MRKNTLSIDCENILPIIKKWLYSSRDIFLRELVSNASDAIRKLRTLAECGHAAQTTDSFEIRITIDKAKKTLTISDNGIGMTEEEVEKYIARIAFSGAEEFVSKYQAQTEKDPIIGHFGLGFYSAYMVASLVEITTRSHLPGASAVSWRCDGTASYEIGTGSRESVGTDVILHLNDESLEYLEEPKVRELLNRFCAFMPEPVSLNGHGIGNAAPLWMKNASDCSEKDYIAFYRKLYPLDSDPLFWIHLNVDYPFKLQGILYFPKTRRRVDDETPSIRLFCNRVFVSEHCREILPDYLTILRGAIDSPDIPLNVSRSYLQVDHNVRQLGAHIVKKVADRLVSLFRTDRSKYIALWPEIEPLLKLGILQDEKFYERTKDALIWKSSEHAWTNIQEYLDRAKEKKIYYASEDQSAMIRNAFLEKKIELLYTGSPIDSAVMSTLEDKLRPIKFQRIDSALDPVLLDDTREKTLLDADGKTAACKIAELFRAQLGQENLEVEAKSLSSDALAGMVVINEESRRLRDYLMLTQGKSDLPSFGKQTFVVNTNHKLVQNASRLFDKQPDLAKQLIRQIYDLARLSQKELSSSEIDAVIAREHELMERLAAQVT